MPKRPVMWDSLKLKFQIVVGCLTKVLGTELGSSGRTAHALYPGAIPLIPINLLNIAELTHRGHDGL